MVCCFFSLDICIGLFLTKQNRKTICKVEIYVILETWRRGDVGSQNKAIAASRNWKRSERFISKIELSEIFFKVPN
jgi:hypothetical protein